MSKRKYHLIIFGFSFVILLLSQPVLAQPDLTSGCNETSISIVLDTVPGDFTEDGVPLFAPGDYYINSVIQNIGNDWAIWDSAGVIWEVYLDSLLIQTYSSGIPDNPNMALYNPFQITTPPADLSRGGRIWDEWLELIPSPLGRHSTLPNQPLLNQYNRTFIDLNEDQNSRDIVFTEDFEGAFPGDWTIIDYYESDGGGGEYLISQPTENQRRTRYDIWSQTSTMSHSGAFSAVQYFSANHYLETGLLSPPIDLSGYANDTISLSFWQYEAYADWHVWHDVTIYIDGYVDGGWVGYTQLDPGTDSSWTQVTVDLSAYGGESNVQIEFYYEGQDADDWYIDDIEISTVESTTFSIGPGECLAGFDPTPYTLAVGEHLLELIIDGDSLITELNEENNNYSRIITVTDSLPDIVVSPVSLVNTIVAGTVDTFMLTIENIGTGDLSWSLAFEDLVIPESVMFTKADNADISLPQNQDRITENVWLTRGTRYGLWNVAQQSGWNWYGPYGTEWAWGPTSPSSSYTSWRYGVRQSGWGPRYALNEDNGVLPNPRLMSLHLIAENLYFDIEWHSWTCCNSGGGFSYTRTRAEEEWIWSISNEGSILPDSSYEVEIVIDAAWFVAGLYEANLHFYSNDLDEPITTVPVELTVEGSPEIGFDQDSLRFENVYIDGHKTLELMVMNTGTDLLSVTDIQSTDAIFTVDPASFVLGPADHFNFDYQIVNVTFSPTAVGYRIGDLIVSSNSIGGLDTVTVFGNGLEPPDINITPDSLSSILMSGNMDSSQTLTIGNTGVNDLIWSIAILESDETGQRIENTVTFTKEDYTDWTLPENQDRITDNVWITRANTRGIFNIAQETEYDRNNWTSPRDTEWSYGYTTDLQPEDYQPWAYAIDWEPYDEMPGQPMSVHLISDDIYLDLVFHNWTSGDYGGGGGFSYTRTRLGLDWFEIRTYRGVTAPGESVVVEILFDATGKPGGDYFAFVAIESDDPDESLISIPVHMFVDGVTSVPEILAVTDVPEDQGGWVTVDFVRSYWDNGMSDDQRTPEMYTVELDDGSGWTAAATTVAYGVPDYSVLVHTTVDSSDDSEGILQFRVIAGMDEGVFISEPMPGYSVDNLAPVQPTSLIANYITETVDLNWDEAVDGDFSHFNIYRSDQEFELPDVSLLIGSTENNQYTDEDVVSLETYFYRVSAVDFNGNESDLSESASLTLSIEDGIGIPDRFALHQNYPNPFNPITAINYDLPIQSHVAITIYDMLGRVVKTLVNRTEEPGYKRVIWDGSNNDGLLVGTGVYILTIQAGDFSHSRKMILLK